MKSKKPSPEKYTKKKQDVVYSKFGKPGVCKKIIDPVVRKNDVRSEALIFDTFKSKTTPGSSTKVRENTFYTGDNLKGISLVHKSGFMPVFTDEQAKDFANMRR